MAPASAGAACMVGTAATGAGAGLPCAHTPPHDNTSVSETTEATDRTFFILASSSVHAGVVVLAVLVTRFKLRLPTGFVTLRPILVGSRNLKRVTSTARTTT